MRCFHRCYQNVRELTPLTLRIKGAERSCNFFVFCELSREESRWTGNDVCNMGSI